MTTEMRLEDYPLASHTAPERKGSPRIPKALRRIVSLADFEAAAKRHLPSPLFAYINSGCEDEIARAGNLSAFEEFDWIPRSLVDTSSRTLTTSLLGATYAAPFGIAPMGISALTAYRGDLIQTSEANSANIPAIMSGSSLIPMEEIAKTNPNAWFQAYVPGETDRILALLGRVEQAGFRTLVVTCDVAVSGNRNNLIKARFSTPLRPNLRLALDGLTHPRWLFGTALRTVVNHGLPHFENSYATRGAPILSSNVLREFGAREHLNWQHLDLIRKRWKGKLVVKGVLAPESAVRARECGADGVIVSNHGGRQLDRAVAPLRILPDIATAVGPEYPIMIDGGFRRGSDILMALALGAKFVFVGRPFNYAGAVGYRAGIKHAIGILATEISRNMALLGANSPADLDSSFLRRRSVHQTTSLG